MQNRARGEGSRRDIFYTRLLLPPSLSLSLSLSPSFLFCFFSPVGSVELLSWFRRKYFHFWPDNEVIGATLREAEESLDWGDEVL